jgi:MoaA/NifB/PqqE/SkfB family radical SAM enzyme
MDLAGRIVTIDKLGYHQDKLRQYIRGDSIYPITVELDLTTACTRRCPGCATVTRPPGRGLDSEFIHGLLSYLGESTRGLLLAGGEPTLAHSFCETLQMASNLGYLNIAVITNGAHLDDPKIARALVDYATCVRVSINHAKPKDYGQSFGCDPSELSRVLKSIEQLRKMADDANSQLQIGVASLSDPGNIGQLQSLVGIARNVGAHWIYFHPYCSGWDDGFIKQADQSEAFLHINEIVGLEAQNFPVLLFEERYKSDPVFFNGYHSTFFLLMVGGDRKIYLSAETKYQKGYEVYDLSDWHSSDFIRDPVFRNNVLSFSSQDYIPIYSKGRGVLYSSIVESISSGSVSLDEIIRRSSNIDPQHVHIL